MVDWFKVTALLTASFLPAFLTHSRSGGDEVLSEARVGPVEAHPRVVAVGLGVDPSLLLLLIVLLQSTELPVKPESQENSQTMQKHSFRCEVAKIAISYFFLKTPTQSPK